MAKIKKLQPGDAAPNGVALNADGQEVALAGFWAEGPVLLTFLRHFG
jgi:hypothetical protein